MQKAQKPGDFEQEINIQELLGLLWSRKGVIISVLAGVMALSLLYYFSATPKYSATSVVLVKDSKNSDPLSQMLGSISTGMAKPILNDIELLKSMPIAEEAVRGLDKAVLRDSLELFGERHYVSKLAMAIGGGLPKFSFGKSISEDTVKESYEQRMRRLAHELQKRVSVENSRETSVLKVSVSSPFPEEAALLSNALCQAYQQKDIAWNAEQARMLNQFVGEQMNKQQDKVASAENKLSGYMQRQEIYELTGNAQQLLEKLIEVDSKYNEVMAEYNILSKRIDFIKQRLSAEEKTISANIAQSVNSQLRSVQDRIKQEEADYMMLVQEKGLGNAEVKARRVQLDQMKAQLEQIARGKIAGELAYAGRAKQYQFDLISEQLQSDIRLAELNYAGQELKRLKNNYEGQLNSLPKKQLDYARLQRDREVVSNTYTFLKQKHEESRIQIASEVGHVVIVGEAFPPESPDAPDLKKILLVAMVLGLGLGGGVVFMMEMQDQTVKDGKFFDDHGLVTLAYIPYYEGKGGSGGNGVMKKGIASAVSGIENISGSISEVASKSGKGSAKKSKASGDKPALLITDSLSSAFAESFRDLRTAISFSRADEPMQSILVTGTTVSEGKSTVASNLGLAFALVGKRVLVVDCDLRRPSQHENFKLNRIPGLTDYLTGQKSDIASLVQNTMHENLFVLPAGSSVPNPNELLGSNRMLETMAMFEELYDFVILDTPPLLLISDTALLSKAVDGILMVSKMGYSLRKPFEEIVKLDYLTPLLLGVALIGSSDAGRYGYDRYGYKGYGYKYKGYYKSNPYLS
jgi:capsular exopolysaccharide synthesis family protein